MIKNYCKLAWRHFKRDTASALINIICLSAGLSTCLLIFVFVSDELGYDSFNLHYKRIVRVTVTKKLPGQIIESAFSGAAMAASLQRNYPEVEKTVRPSLKEELVEHNNSQSLEHILLADPSFFSIFSYRLTKGDSKTALEEPFSVILTKAAAIKYFGNADPIGKTLKIYLYDSAGNGVDYMVTGITPDPPANSHISFTLIASFKTAEFVSPAILMPGGWGNGKFYTYLLLRDGTNNKSLSAKITAFYCKYIGELNGAWRNTFYYRLQSLEDIHLYSKLQNEPGTVGNINNVRIFSLAAIIILLLAGINYSNLATARAGNRAKETGIKKMAGASSKMLAFQYLSESVLTAMIAFLFSIILAWLALPLLNQVIGKQLSLFSNSLLLLFLLVVSLAVGLLSGLYPAFVLSGYQPVVVLKGSYTSGTRGVLLRKLLVLVQFTISIVLVTGIVIVFRQMSYIQNKDLGYNKDELFFLRVNGNTDIIKGYMPFKQALESNPLVKASSVSNSAIVNGLGTVTAVSTVGRNNPLSVTVNTLNADTAFIHVYEIKLLAGHNFTGDSTRNGLQEILLNETAVRNFGWNDPYFAIGKPLTIDGIMVLVAGVVRDFNFSSLQHAIGPLAISRLDKRFSRITLRINMQRSQESLAWVQKTWKQYFPSALFDASFVNSQLELQYREQKQFFKMFLYFSILSLLIAGLGLYGLVAFAVTQKTKEIGIRKVLGAPLSSIVLMLAKDFGQLIILACLVAIPLAAILIQYWLRDFAYRTTLHWWIFLLPLLIVMTTIMIATALQIIRAALANPVNSMRVS